MKLTSLTAIGVALLFSACATEAPMLGTATGAPVASTTGPADTSATTCRSDRILASLRDQSDGIILIAAHRGAHLDQPENSLPAIRRAVEVGADIVEIDIRLTRDGVPILMHDETVDRTTNGTGAVAEMTLEEIRALRLRGPDGEITDLPVPTLEEALEIGTDRVLINLDLKSDAVPAVVEIVRGHPKAKVMYYNSNVDVLTRIRANIMGALLMPIAESPDDALRLVQSFKPEIVHLRASYADRALADRLDVDGVANWLNALGEVDDRIGRGGAAAADDLIGVRPDVLQTDQPERLRSILAGRGMARADTGETFDAPCRLISTP